MEGGSEGEGERVGEGGREGKEWKEEGSGPVVVLTELRNFWNSLAALSFFFLPLAALCRDSQACCTFSMLLVITVALAPGYAVDRRRDSLLSSRTYGERDSSL